MRNCKIVAQIAMLVLTVGIIGCQMTPKQLARNTTVATLTFTGASKETAQKVKQFAVDVQEAAKKDGILDRQALLKKADEQIAKLGQRERAIFMAIRNQIVDIVIQALASDQNIRDAIIVIREVAEGVEEGADIVIMSFEIRA